MPFTVFEDWQSILATTKEILYVFIHHSFAPAARRGVTCLWKLTILSSEGKSTIKQLAEESSEGVKAASNEVVMSA